MNTEQEKLEILTIEKQILRDISAGIFRELEYLSQYVGTQKYYEHLKVVGRYANNLRKICE